MRKLHVAQGPKTQDQTISSPALLAAFVRDATREHNEGGPPVPLASYGYLWWIARAPGEARAYFASGFGGQLVYVVPDRDLVVAMAADNVGTASRRFINQDVLPALGLP